MRITKDNEELTKDNEESAAMFEHESRRFFVICAQPKKPIAGTSFRSGAGSSPARIAWLFRSLAPPAPGANPVRQKEAAGLHREMSQRGMRHRRQQR